MLSEHFYFITVQNSVMKGGLLTARKYCDDLANYFGQKMDRDSMGVQSCVDDV